MRARAVRKSECEQIHLNSNWLARLASYESWLVGRLAVFSRLRGEAIKNVVNMLIDSRRLQSVRFDRSV